jgi:hypothetical protein
LGGEGYGNVRPFGLGDGAFDSYVIYFSVIISTLSFGVEISIGALGDCKDCAMSWKGVLGFVVEVEVVGWLRFDLRVGVVLRWVSDLRNC